MEHLKMLLSLLALTSTASALDNGLARTPPMGWMSWERFRCNTDCANDPLNCISESLIMDQASAMVSGGFLAAGYEYIIIDDCWLSHERDENGKLQPDPDRFPSGIKYLSDFVHSLGLKFGIYEDYGNLTCGGYPGILGHLEDDANTFAEWEVDYVKLDGCYSDIHDMDQGYPQFGAYLNATGRPMVYSCSWPAYWEEEVPNYPLIAESCNLWRNYGDIQDSWESMLDIIDHYGDKQDEFAQYAGPGNWNDPDMLIIGDFALSYDQSVAQMSVWAVLAAPLIMSNDMRNIRPEYVEILQNANVIKVNQDPLGHQARRVLHDTTKHIDIFVKNVMPIFQGDTSAAVSILYRGTDGTPAKVSFAPSDYGLNHAAGYMVMDVFTGDNLGSVTPSQKVDFMVNPSGARLIRFDVKASKAIPPKNSKNHLTKGSSYEVVNMGKTGWLSDEL